jgi:hypothetical protein
VTASGTWQTTYGWTIQKSVTPNKWKLADNQSGISTYTVILTKDSGTTVGPNISGVVTVNNIGPLATIGLAINIKLTRPESTDELQSVIIGSPAQIGAYQTGSYPYTIGVPTPVSGNYEITADVTITNYSGFPGTPKGPGPSLSNDIVFGSGPLLVNDTVHVVDVFDGTAPVSLGTFNAGETITYPRTFKGTDARFEPYNNTATIVETQQSATAGVLVYHPSGYPTPELPAAALLGLGLAGVGSFILLRRRPGAANTR